MPKELSTTKTIGEVTLRDVIKDRWVCSEDLCETCPLSMEDGCDCRAWILRTSLFRCITKKPLPFPCHIEERLLLDDKGFVEAMREHPILTRIDLACAKALDKARTFADRAEHEAETFLFMASRSSKLTIREILCDPTSLSEKMQPFLKKVAETVDAIVKEKELSGIQEALGLHVSLYTRKGLRKARWVDELGNVFDKEPAEDGEEKE